MIDQSTFISVVNLFAVIVGAASTVTLFVVNLRGLKRVEAVQTTLDQHAVGLEETRLSAAATESILRKNGEDVRAAAETAAHAVANAAIIAAKVVAMATETRQKKLIVQPQQIKAKNKKH